MTSCPIPDLQQRAFSRPADMTSEEERPVKRARTDADIPDTSVADVKQSRARRICVPKARLTRALFDAIDRNPFCKSVDFFPSSSLSETTLLRIGQSSKRWELHLRRTPPIRKASRTPIPLPSVDSITLNHALQPSILELSTCESLDMDFDVGDEVIPSALPASLTSLQVSGPLHRRGYVQTVHLREVVKACPLLRTVSAHRIDDLPPLEETHIETLEECSLRGFLIEGLAAASQKSRDVLRKLELSVTKTTSPTTLRAALHCGRLQELEVGGELSPEDLTAASEAMQEMKELHMFKLNEVETPTMTLQGLVYSHLAHLTSIDLFVQYIHVREEDIDGLCGLSNLQSLSVYAETLPESWPRVLQALPGLRHCSMGVQNNVNPPLPLDLIARHGKGHRLSELEFYGFMWPDRGTTCSLSVLQTTFPEVQTLYVCTPTDDGGEYDEFECPIARNITSLQLQPVKENIRHREDWCMGVFGLCFCRANRGHPLCDSVIDVASLVSDMLRASDQDNFHHKL